MLFTDEIRILKQKNIELYNDNAKLNDILIDILDKVDDECCICLDNLSNDRIHITGCRQLLHKSCYDLLLEHKIKDKHDANRD